MRAPNFVFPSVHFLVSNIDFSGVFLAKKLYGLDIKRISIAFAIVAMQAIEMIAIRKVLGLLILRYIKIGT